MASKKIPDTCSVSILVVTQPILLIKGTIRMLHAHTLKPGGFGRMHTALIDFKQVNDTIPRQELWQYLQRTSMPASFLPIIQDMHDADEYILKDGERTAQVYPNTGVKQGCPLSLLLFSLYINDVDEIAEGVQGAVTGTPGSSVTHMLYADDLTLMSNDPDAMQTMLNRLHCMLRESTSLSIMQSLMWFIQFIWFKCACVQRWGSAAGTPRYF